MPGYSLTLLPDRLAVCRLPAASPVPVWADGTGFLTITRAAEELSLICAASRVPPDVRAVAGWRVLKVEGPFDFGVTGVIAALSGVLATAGVSLLPIATFDTDYLLVKDADLDRAMTALAHAGHSVGPGTALA